MLRRRWDRPSELYQDKTLSGAGSRLFQNSQRLPESRMFAVIQAAGKARFGEAGVASKTAYPVAMQECVEVLGRLASTQMI